MLQYPLKNQEKNIIAKIKMETGQKWRWKANNYRLGMLMEFLW